MRKGAGYVSYDYYTNGYKNQGNFGVHVTVAQADDALEAALDRLVPLVYEDLLRLARRALEIAMCLATDPIVPSPP